MLTPERLQFSVHAQAFDGHHVVMLAFLEWSRCLSCQVGCMQAPQRGLQIVIYNAKLLSKKDMLWSLPNDAFLALLSCTFIIIALKLHSMHPGSLPLRLPSAYGICPALFVRTIIRYKCPHLMSTPHVHEMSTPHVGDEMRNVFLITLSLCSTKSTLRSCQKQRQCCASCLLR
jgi:hypothetical protein